jgi:hypothetical protein
MLRRAPTPVQLLVQQGPVGRRLVQPQELAEQLRPSQGLALEPVLLEREQLQRPAELLVQERQEVPHSVQV